MSWKKRVIFLSELDHDVDYLVFIDESGDSSYKKILKNGPNVPKNDQFFIITACVFKMDYYRELGTKITELKRRHWQNGMYIDGKGNLKRVCLHGSEINNKLKAFDVNLINYSAFSSDLHNFMSNLETTIFSVCVNKSSMCKTYSNPFDPYELSMKFVFERLCKYFLKPQEKAIIIFEQRDKKKDKMILKKAVDQLNSGTEYTDSTIYSSIDGIYFNPKYLAADKTFYGLEIADLCCYAIYKKQFQTDYTAFNIIAKYFYGGEYPLCFGKGFKKFPHY